MVVVAVVLATCSWSAAAAVLVAMLVSQVRQLQQAHIR
jgi:hypothetical protein